MHTLSRQLLDFESEFADIVGVQHAVVATSPAGALRLALRLVGVAHQASVVMPAPFWVVGVPVVTALGAQSALADIDAETGLATPHTISLVLRPGARVVIVDDTAGMPADLDRVCEVAREQDATVIEYVGVAAGALYKGDPVGSRADIAIWSLKEGPLGPGEGAVLTFNREDWAAYGRLVRKGPLPPDHQLRAALDRAYGMHDATFTRRAAVERLSNELRQIEGIRLVGDGGFGTSSCWSVGIEALVGDALSRDRIVEALCESGLPARAGWGASGTSSSNSSNDWLPVTTRMREHSLTVPGAAVADADRRATIGRILREEAARPLRTA